jgi:DNA-directed RNA polymerase subunit RPC12/RpoP
MSYPFGVAMKVTKVRCSVCGREVSLDQDGKKVTHGPGPKGEFVCPGTGNKALVKAARRLRIDQAGMTGS